MKRDQVKIANVISHLFDNKNHAEKIIKFSDCLECRDNSISSNYPGQELFHCELQPIHTLTEKDYRLLENIRRKKNELKVVSFHMASCYANPQIDDRGYFCPSGKKIQKSQLLSNAEYNFRYIKDFFGSDVKIAVENNNYFSTEAYDNITCPDFISSVVKSNEIYFLYDLSHARISSHNMGMKFQYYENQLPLNKTIQIHLSKESYKKNGEIYDAHKIPQKEDLIALTKIIDNYNSIKYVTVEYYKDLQTLESFLIALRKHLNG